MQRRAYIIADNKLALNAGWDEEMLAIDLRDLRDFDFDLSLTGFESADLERLLDDPTDQPQQTSTKEINTDEYEMGNLCPRCGFEFDNKEK